MELSGVILPLTTPFEGEKIAPERLADNLSRYERHGVTGYLLLGSTGEAPLLGEEEKVELVAAARETITSGRGLLAGAGLESTAATCRLAGRLGEAGADAVLVVTPSYFRGNLDDEALARHFEAVADASPVPVLLYNIPAFTSVVIPPAVVDRVADHPNVVGLKDSSGDLGWMVEVLARVPAEFQVLSGSPATFLPALGLGARGGILAAADVLPEPFVRLFERASVGDGAGAVELQKRLIAPVRAIVGRFGVPGVKAAMALRGLYGGAPRRPLLPLDQAATRGIEDVLAVLVEEGTIGGLPL